MFGERRVAFSEWERVSPPYQPLFQLGLAERVTAIGLCDIRSEGK